MIMKKLRNQRLFYFTSILIIITLNFLIFIRTFDQNLNSSLNNDSNSKVIEENEMPKPSADIYYTNVPWLENTDFSAPTRAPWYNSTQGDLTDVTTNYSPGQADYLVLGYEDKKEISNVFVDTSKWTRFNKTDVDTNPDNHDIDNNGIWCDHLYEEDANQFPSIYWRYNVSMGIDMSDYEITSASIKATWNASVNRDFDVEGDTIAEYPSEGIDSRDLYDSIRFTIEVSDMNLSPLSTYLIADNQTINLGRYDGIPPPGYLRVETAFIPKNETDLKFYLERVLENDPNHDNFTILLGMSIICADNSDSGDRDEIFEARIKDVNLTFTYKKKMDKLTTMSWNQEGGMINYTSVQVTDAKLNFEHKIDKNWTESTSNLAENSELRFLINGYPSNTYPTIKLSSLKDTFQEAISGSYDVTNLIPLEENITLTIQVHLADDFILDQPITISIDNVYFVISYVVFNQTVSVITLSSSGGGGGKTKVIEEPWINIVLAIAAIIGGICLGGYLTAYQLYLKYPKPIRKVRKYRKTLNKKKAPSIDILSRESAFKAKYSEHTSLITSLPIGKKVKVKAGSGKLGKKSQMTSINKKAIKSEVKTK